MPDLDWLYAPNLDALIRQRTQYSFSIFSDAFRVFQSPSERLAGVDLISGFLYDRLLQVRDSNCQKEMSKPASKRRTIYDGFTSIDKFTSLVFELPDVGLGRRFPELQDLVTVYNLNFCGFWPFC